MCTLCRRNLLAGERFRFWRSSAARLSDRPVCALCEGAVMRAGWVLAARTPGREGAIGLRGTVRKVA